MQYQTPAYSYASNGLVERFNRALLERLGRLEIGRDQASIDCLVDRVVNVVQDAPHFVLHYSPKEVWEGSPKVWVAALSRLKEDVGRRNRSNRFKPHYFAIGDQVLVWVFNLKNKFQKRWT